MRQQLHDRWTKGAAISQGLVPNHTLNGVPEWAYGVTDGFEQGLYLPLYSDAINLGPVLDGLNIRELFVVPHAADRTSFAA